MLRAAAQAVDEVQCMHAVGGPSNSAAVGGFTVESGVKRVSGGYCRVVVKVVPAAF